jgi:hypothetical protein
VNIYGHLLSAKRNQWNENEIKRNQRKQIDIENGRKNKDIKISNCVEMSSLVVVKRRTVPKR